MGLMNLENEIKAYARELGFDLVKITSAKKLSDAGEYYEKWLQDKHGADMDYLHTETSRRYTPSEILSGAKSIIMLGVNYYQKNAGFSDELHVAKYALGRDYHKVILSKLKKMGKFIEEKSAKNSKSYVDFGPLMERAYAAEAGLGFVGKNACIITREFGSWIFLSEIITELELTPDEQTKWQGKCGSCTRCVNICPTKAIRPDKSIDARRCISYLTIENRGPIPLELRPKIGNWLFGCDLCQDICPHNVRAQSTKVTDFQNISSAVQNLSLSKILSIKTDEEFLNIFAGTPFMRTKRRGLIRNACIVAGNAKRTELLPELTAISCGEDEMLAEHAKWAMIQLI